MADYFLPKVTEEGYFSELTRIRDRDTAFWVFILKFNKPIYSPLARQLCVPVEGAECGFQVSFSQVMRKNFHDNRFLLCRVAAFILDLGFDRESL